MARRAAGAGCGESPSSSARSRRSRSPDVAMMGKPGGAWVESEMLNSGTCVSGGGPAAALAAAGDARRPRGSTARNAVPVASCPGNRLSTGRALPRPRALQRGSLTRRGGPEAASSHMLDWCSRLPGAGARASAGAGRGAAEALRAVRVGERELLAVRRRHGDDGVAGSRTGGRRQVRLSRVRRDVEFGVIEFSAEVLTFA